ncbi:hypothetical protein LEN26_017396 [Aphanomyces euteiches]|nr:hypothetical protein LEN26_017396 [Aphanomyces euteiches]KAH9107473.1 hypothetical protein AeMF1_017188 [Aphanomyces euteiches]KAH9185421.1 hypothetical protein AeNC1_012601 [Aphanomyces euteiches]
MLSLIDCPASPCTSVDEPWSPRPVQKLASPMIAPFLVTLRTMLTYESCEIIRWTSAGTAFEIVDMARFMHIVLPKYFKQTKYSSFQRQLNYFGFKKWTKRRAKVCTFSNACFLRDEPKLAALIMRKRSIPSPKSLPTEAASQFDLLLDFDELDHHLPLLSSTSGIWFEC